MLDENAIPSSLSAARLRVTLASDRTGLSEEAVAEARRLYREQATELVLALVEGALARGGHDPAAVRAAHLAGELRLSGAAPALGRCLERFEDQHPLGRAALAVLPRLEGPGADALLGAFDRCSDVFVRAELAAVLARLTEPADRIRAALLTVASEFPETGADLLAGRGDWRAVPALLAILDRISAAPAGRCALCTWLDLQALAASVWTLGGELTEEQEERLAEAAERAEAECPPWERPSQPPPASVPLERRPGRNDPCPCGSGRKYKRCCLERDARDASH